MKYCFDIDLTICQTSGTDYEGAMPFQERIKKIQGLIAEGHEVIFYTARGFESGTDWREITINQLIDWGFVNPVVFFSKPSADFYIDDKAIQSEDYFE